MEIIVFNIFCTDLYIFLNKAGNFIFYFNYSSFSSVEERTAKDTQDTQKEPETKLESHAC